MTAAARSTVARATSKSRARLGFDRNRRRDPAREGVGPRGGAEHPLREVNRAARGTGPCAGPDKDPGDRQNRFSPEIGPESRGRRPGRRRR